MKRRFFLPYITGQGDDYLWLVRRYGVREKKEGAWVYIHDAVEVYHQKARYPDLEEWHVTLPNGQVLQINGVGAWTLWPASDLPAERKGEHADQAS